MKVCDLPYERYEVERAQKAFETAIEKITNAKSAKEVLDARKDLLNEMEELSTQSSLSYMRWSCDTKNEFYKGEKEYYEQNMPLLSGVQIAYTQAMMNTPFKEEVQKVLPVPVYKNFEVTLKSLDEKIIPIAVDITQEESVKNAFLQINKAEKICKNQ